MKQGTARDASRCPLEMIPVNKIVYGKKYIVHNCNTLAYRKGKNIGQRSFT